jgi:phosphoribosylformylglycinamidine synthase
MPSPERPENMWQIAQSIKGLGEAARAFDVPVVSGNVSLYNETNGSGIHPTPTLAVVGLLDDASLAIGSQFQTAGDIVLVIGDTNESDLGGSEYAALQYAVENGALPAIDYSLEARTCNVVRELISQRLLVSAHDISQGGLGVALAECCFRDYSQPMGVTIQPVVAAGRADAYLFAETGARFIVSCSVKNEAITREVIAKAGLPISCEGVVGGDEIFVKGVSSLSATAAFSAWWGGLDALFEA